MRMVAPHLGTNMGNTGVAMAMGGVVWRAKNGREIAGQFRVLAVLGVSLVAFMMIAAAAQSQTFLMPPESLLGGTSHSPYSRTYTAYLNLWREYLSAPEFPSAEIEVNFKRLRLYDDLTAVCPTSNFVLAAEADHLKFWEGDDSVDTLPADTYPSSSMDADGFDLRYLMFTSREEGGLLNRQKRVIWMHCGIHGGHESSNQMAVLLFVQRLLASRHDPWVEALLRTHIFVVFPAINVFGNFSDPGCQPSYTNRNGVNLITNFGYEFASPETPLGEHWAGTIAWPEWASRGRTHAGVARPFSEPESRIIRNVMISLCHPELGQGFRMAAMIDWHNNGGDYTWVDPNAAVDGASGMYDGIVPEFAREFSSDLQRYKEYFDEYMGKRWTPENIVSDPGSPTAIPFRTLAGSGMVISTGTAVSASDPCTVRVAESDTRAFMAGSVSGTALLRIGSEVFDFAVVHPDSQLIVLTARAARGTTPLDHLAGEQISYAGLPLTTRRSYKDQSATGYSVDWISEIFHVNAVYMEPPAMWRENLKAGQPSSNTEFMYANFLGGATWFIHALVIDKLAPECIPSATTDSLVPPVRVAWRRFPGAMEYHLQWSQDSLFTDIAGETSLTANDTSFAVATAAYGHQLFWRVRASDGAASTRWSLPGQFAVCAEPPRPTFPPISDRIDGSRPTMIWAGTPGPLGYHVQLSTDSLFSSPVLDSSTREDSLRLIRASIALDQNYYWRVRRARPDSLAAWSAIWSFRTTNEPPVLAVGTSFVVLEDSLLTVPIAATDPDSLFFDDSCTIQISGAPWLRYDRTLGVVSGVPRIRDLKDTTLVVYANDGPGAVVASRCTVSILHRNHTPRWLQPDPGTALEGSLWELKAEAVDPDTLLGESIRCAMVSAPPWLSFDSSQTHLSGTPLAHDVGVHEVVLSATDDSGAVAYVTFILPVQHKNHPPVFGISPVLTAVEDASFTLVASASDPDSALFNDRVWYTLQPESTWLSIDPTTGVLTGTPRIEHLGDTLFTIIATDDSGATDTLPLTIPIRHVNHPPVFTAMDPVSAAEDTAHAFHVAATDPDSILGDRIRYRMVLGPAWLSVDSLTGHVSGTPGPADVGTTPMTLIARDDSGAIGMVEIPVTVRHTNHPPVVTALPVPSAVEDTLYSSRIVAEDRDSDRFEDVLRFTAILKPAWLTLDTLTGAVSGIPRAGQLNEATLAVMVSDGRGGTALATTSLTVAHTNHPPVFALTSHKDLTATEDELFTLNAAASDPDALHHGDRIAYALAVAPYWLSIDPQTGIVTGTPREGDADTTFTVQASDGASTTSVTIALPVQAVNDPPVLTAHDPVTMLEDDSLFIPSAIWSALAADPDDGDSSMTWTTRCPQGVSARWTARGLILRPSRDWFGTTDVTVLVTDPGGLADSIRLTVTVDPVNDPPIVAGLPDIILRGETTVTLPLASFVSDVDDSAATLFADARIGRNGGEDDAANPQPDGTKDAPGSTVRLSLDGTRSLTLTVPPGYASSALPVILRVFDAAGAVGADTLFLSAAPPNAPPVIHASLDTSALEVGKAFTAKLRWTDADTEDAVATYSFSGPAWLRMDSAGTITGSPVAPGEDSLMVVVTDTRGASDTLRIRLVVRAAAESGIPADYVLLPNYPNPFNPLTTVRFGLPEPSRVSAAVYNLLGQRVAMLLDGDVPAGYHILHWEPSRLASGAYVLVLHARGLVSTTRESRLLRKMTLLK